jgi:hypothetical protein
MGGAGEGQGIFAEVVCFVEFSRRKIIILDL